MENLNTMNNESPTAIQEWLVSYLAEALEIKPEEIHPQTQFNEFGLDSSAAVILTGDLGEWLGYDLDPTLLQDYPTLEKLVTYLKQ